ncbi:MAG TPA: glycoside hydrolase domain-containing protein, partial [Gemmatimonadales bacterium]|nr:glycoside hydrolase domain-containing protein [Gemmatimonadales bacterium]
MNKLALVVALLLPAGLHAQEVPYRLGHWDPDSLGNHRAVIQVAGPATVKAVQVTLPWRRRDADPERKLVIITNAEGRRVTNAVPIAVTREAGTFAFEPTEGPGEYYLYFMPYKGSVRSNYPRITYRTADTTAGLRWMMQRRVTPADIAAGRWRQLPKATVEAFEAVDSMSNRWPMEVIATAAETEVLRRNAGSAPFVLFAEDRTRPIIMKDDLPQAWTAAGRADGPVTGEALRSEFFTFQLGVW